MDAEQNLLHELTKEPLIAYFTMEIGINSSIPTYSGGLGVLAGDTIKSGADLALPMVAVTLLTRKGYFRQELDAKGRQIEHPYEWDPATYMTRLSHRVTVEIEGRPVLVQAWMYMVQSLTGGRVPVFFLDTALEANAPEDREITAQLYGGDEVYRLKQEIVLGLAGARMLKALGFEIKKYHLNEGHASLLTLELLNKFKRPIEDVWDEKLIWDVNSVKDLCVFTTHTPVQAGHDRFPYDLVQRVLGDLIPLDILKGLAGPEALNMTVLALNLTEFVNGVAKKHGEVSRTMFPGYKINAITNGVHSYTWTGDSFKRLYDKYLPVWANEPELFVRVGRIPDNEIWAAHQEAKGLLLDYVRRQTGVEMDLNTLTLGFARRATAYKRADLLFSDLERLKQIGTGKLQIIYAGKAHPQDTPGKALIEKIFSYKQQLADRIKIVFLSNYDMDIALKMVSGVDVWLNTPQRPREASGTSGMKAAHNGVMNFSVLDGWWIEGYIEGDTGWSIGPPPLETRLEENHDTRDADDLYEKLEKEIIPTYYDARSIWVYMMGNAIGQNAYYFNTHRMMRRYVTEAYIR
ncbi:MAG: alpha-glucan family phosphorylase [Desulfobacterota bacterium]|nr:alpha-glucan family phosphorylase [Thermodesulfobacteriota bacterium]